MNIKHVNDGDTVILDDGFTCRKAGRATIHKDSKGLYFLCDAGKHYLDGQEWDDGELIGITPGECK